MNSSPTILSQLSARTSRQQQQPAPLRTLASLGLTSTPIHPTSPNIVGGSSSLVFTERLLPTVPAGNQPANQLITSPALPRSSTSPQSTPLYSHVPRSLSRNTHSASPRRTARVGGSPPSSYTFPSQSPERVSPLHNNQVPSTSSQQEDLITTPPFRPPSIGSLSGIHLSPGSSPRNVNIITDRIANRPDSPIYFPGDSSQLTSSSEESPHIPINEMSPPPSPAREGLNNQPANEPQTTSSVSPLLDVLHQAQPLILVPSSIPRHSLTRHRSHSAPPLLKSSPK